MTKPFTLEDLKALHPCSEGLAWASSCKSMAEAWDTCERADWMIWALRKLKLLEKPVAVEFAIACAERVLPIFEKKYPDDKRPRLALEAAKTWLKEPTEANRNAAYAAAAAAAAADAAAYAAADAAAADAAADADAADAAADAATYAATYAAAAAATYAATYAAAAAADAAADAAAYAAAADAHKSECKWQADKLRQLVPNPFTP